MAYDSLQVIYGKVISSIYKNSEEVDKLIEEFIEEEEKYEDIEGIHLNFTHSGEDEPTISIGVDLNSEVLPWGFTAVSNLNLSPTEKQIKEFQEIDKDVLELLPDDLKETYRSLTVDTYFVGSGS